MKKKKHEQLTAINGKECGSDDSAMNENEQDFTLRQDSLFQNRKKRNNFPYLSRT